MYGNNTQDPHVGARSHLRHGLNKEDNTEGIRQPGHRGVFHPVTISRNRGMLTYIVRSAIPVARGDLDVFLKSPFPYALSVWCTAQLVLTDPERPKSSP